MEPSACVMMMSGLIFPKIKATKTVDKTSIHIGESINVGIKVDGNEQSQSVPVPISIVIVLDESGSMINDCTHSRAAARDLANSLRPGDKVGLVVFSTIATKLVSLTNNHGEVEQALNALGPPNGYTNLSEALTLSYQILANDVNYNRIIILLSDGEPKPDPNIQKDQIMNTLVIPQKNNIRIYSVGFGQNIDLYLMKDISKDTGGQFYFANNSSEIYDCFDKAFKSVNQMLYVQQVKIYEQITQNFKVIPDSFSNSTGFVDLPQYLKDEIDTAKQSFYNNGTIEFPIIPFLKKGEHFSFYFTVKARYCNDNDVTYQLNEPNRSYVKYNFGNDSSQHIENINQVDITVKPCGVYITKNFDEDNQKVTITVLNGYPDRDIVDVFIQEITGKDVGIYTNSISPPPPQGNAISLQEVRWTIPNIPPNTEQEFSFKCFNRTWTQQSPIYINKEYPPQEHVAGIAVGKIHYKYQDQFGNWVSKQENLPELSVQSLDIPKIKLPEGGWQNVSKRKIRFPMNTPP